MADRDLRIFIVTEKSSAALELRKRFGVGKNNLFSVLIGKDGTRKMRKARPVSSEELLHLIDSMPMRKAEMRERH